MILKISLFAMPMLSLISALSCTTNTLEPNLNPQIVNQTDYFEFKIVNVRYIDQQLVYQWQNNGITANIFNGSAITEGKAAVTISDTDGVKVFSEDLEKVGSLFSSSGESGQWRIEMNLTNVSGTVHIRVERRF